MKLERSILVCAIVISAAFARLIPHPPNFTPIVAMSLFSGAYISKRFFAIALIFSSMLLSDLFLGFHETWSVVYLSLALIVVIGGAISNRTSVLSIMLATLTSSILFFVVTNFGVWLLQDMYPKTIAGLGTCYVLALPFFQTELLGSFFFVALIFGAFFVLEPKAKPAVN